MANSEGDVAQRLASGIATPIAQLDPDLTEQSNRIVRGEVTIVWPYNSVNKSLAFLIAEPDVRLRRAKGLIRVQLNGASAEAVASCSLGGGDEVRLSLDGVEWEKDDAPSRPAGSRSEWQLQFSNKIILEAKLVETEETKVVNISHTAPPEPIKTTVENILQIQKEPAIPEPIPEITAAPTPRRLVNGAETGEYPSPAFIKRARVSYGALLETDFDELEEDGGVKGKGRKKPRFSVGGGRWRYQSTTPSPEPEIQETSSPEAEVSNIKARDSTPPKPQMLDEGSQTVETELTPAPQLTATPGEQSIFGLEPSSPLERQALSNVFAPNTDIGVQTQRSVFATHATNEHPPLYQNTSTGFAFGQSASQALQHTVINASEDGYSVPRFQAAMPGPQFGGPELSLGDQVRFGFSHQPQPAFSQVREDVNGHPEHHTQQAPDAYPETYLDHSTTPGHLQSDIHGDFQAEAGTHMTQDQYAVVGQPQDRDHRANRRPSGQQELLLWPIDAPSMDYEHAVAHVDVDAPLPAQESHHTIKDDLRSNGSEPEEEPLVSNDDEARELQAEAELEQPIYRQGGAEEQALVGPENDLEEVDEDISSEEEADYDEDQVGDDYDMRNYADVEDDEEGFESQEEDAPLPDGEIMDEDGEGSYDEDEEGSYDEEEDYEEEDNAGVPERTPLHYPPPSRGPPIPTKSSGPVVIDLISDSEDDDDIQPVAATPRDQYDGAADIKPPAKAPGSALGDDNLTPNRAFRGASLNDDVTSSNTALKEESPSYEVEPDSDSEEEDESVKEGSISEQSEEQSDFEDEAEDEEEVEEDEVINAEEVSMVVEASIIQPDSDSMLSGDEREAREAREEPARQIQISTSPERVSSQLPLSSLEEVAQQPQDSIFEDRDILMEDVIHDGSHTRVKEAQPEGLQDVAMAEGSEMLQAALRLSQETAQVVKDFVKKLETSDEQQDDQQILPSSPPLTQQFESQVIPVENLLPTNLTSSQPTVNDDNDDDDQLPTPHDTQLPDSVSFQPPLDDEKNILEVAQEVTTSSEDLTLQPPAELASEENQVSRQKTPAIELSHPTDTQISPEIVADTMPQKSPEPTIADNIAVASSGDVQNQEPDSRGAEEQRETPQGLHDLKSQGSLVTALSSVSENADDKDQDEPVDVVKVQAEDKIEPDGPAASTRRLRSRAPPPPPVDRSIQLARAAIASKRGKRATDQAPVSPRTTRTRSMSFQKSTTPETEDQSVQRARAALKSPSKRKSESLVEQLKSDLSKKLPVEMPDCIPLKLLWSHHNKNLDIAAVATTSSSDPQRAKGGPRQYIMSFNITDPSIGPSEVAEAHFFRAHKDFLPAIKPGDAVLLRNFTVTPLKDKGFGLRSHDDSSWAVFDKDDGPAPIRGPPIELNDNEIDYMITLKKWYAALDQQAQSELDKANQKFAEVNRAK